MRRRTEACVRVGALLALCASAPSPVTAQQYVTDDAAISEFRACQLQLWYGQRSSWVLPVCTPAPDLELSVGFIAVSKDGANGHVEYVAQAKTALPGLRTNAVTTGFVFGTGRDPGLLGPRRPSTNVYAYVPASVSLAGNRLRVHENVGWFYEERHAHRRHALTLGARADLALTSRVTAVAEAYGAGGNRAEFQAGIRTWFRSSRQVQLDVSYGAELRTGRDGPGWTVGLTLVTPPFL
jgi:hypothetical protein